MHHDESLHAYYAWVFSEGGGLIHNPMLHGPLQMQLSGIIFFVFGDNDFTARILYAVAGISLSIIPFLIRNLLGRFGALSASCLIAISPTMVYFSRFARNDILMAVVTLLLVVCVWKYFQSGKIQNLYWFSGLLAVSYTIKETSYLITGIFGLYFVILTVEKSLKNSSLLINLDKDTYLKIIRKIIGGFTKTISSGLERQKSYKQVSLLILTFTLTLPQWAAFSSLLESILPSIILVRSNYPGEIGMPMGLGNLIALLIVISLLIFTIFVGVKWNWKIWGTCAALFYVIWTLSYTTFLTNIAAGIKSGIWQSLGYWIVQQGEGRGGQPIQYYAVLSSIYEFFPMLFAIFAILQIRHKRDHFTCFLAYWVIITFVLYTIASEKMPWLLVNITLPTIILAGKYIGEKIEAALIEFSKVNYQTRIFFILFNVTIATILISAIVIYEFSKRYSLFAMFLCVTFIAISLFIKIKTDKPFTTRNLSFILAAIILSSLTMRATFNVAFKNQDTPVEMLVYTQTSPKVRTIANEITRSIDTSSPSKNLTISVDQTSGFTWPWTWYLRNYEKTSFPLLSSSSDLSESDSDILLVHSSNRVTADTTIPDEFSKGITYPHRWWFPEDTYRNFNILDYFDGKKPFINTLNYWLLREGIKDRIGSEDGILYYRTSSERAKNIGTQLTTN